MESLQQQRDEARQTCVSVGCQVIVLQSAILAFQTVAGVDAHVERARSERRRPTLSRAHMNKYHYQINEVYSELTSMSVQGNVGDATHY